MPESPGGWLRLSAASDADHADSIAERLSEAGAVAVSLLPNQAEFGAHAATSGDVLEPAPSQMPLWNAVRIQALLPLTANLSALPTLDFDIDFLADEDWSETWRNSFKPMRFGRLVVLPKEPRFESGSRDVALRLDPGLAFGTGSHPSTALCLNWLAGRSLVGQRILDVGAGSGVLAIAAALLGAKTTMGVDHDPQARRAAVENAHANGVALTVLEDLQEIHGHFDVAIANIVANTLCDMAPTLTAHADTIVLSGILEAQTEQVMSAFPAFHFQPPTVQDGWALLAGCHV